MAQKALFSGLVVDEFDRKVETVHIGDEPCYVVDDAGFKRIYLLPKSTNRSWSI